MAFVLKDRVKETTATAGTGSVTLLGASQGYQGFSAIGDGNTTYYCIAGTSEWEVGIGTYSGGLLSRDTVLASSASGAKVGFSSGTKDVFCTYAAVSVNGGYTNTVSANYATVGGGYANSATADYAVVGGGGSNQATGATSIVAGGLGNIASGLFASSGGGNNNTASGQGAVVPGGSNNVSSGQYSGVLSGSTNTASGDNSFVAGGDTNVASGRFSGVIGGQYGTTRGIVGYLVTPASETPIQAKAGVQQAGCLVLGVQTTNATPVVMRSNSSAAGLTNQLVLANNSALLVNINMIAWDQTSWYTVTRQGVLTRGASASTVVYTDVGSSTSSRSLDGGAATWAISQAADTTNGGLAVTVTGQAGKTIRWVCRLETTEVSY